MRWVAVVLLLAPAAVLAQEAPRGLYAVSTRLELPHLEAWAVERTELVCIDDGALPVPLVRTRRYFVGCAVEDLRREADRLSYRIECAGRDAARARAAYRLEADGFRGRVAVVMGAKNMTMTEVQSGRRLGACSVAEAAHP